MVSSGAAFLDDIATILLIEDEDNDVVLLKHALDKILFNYNLLRAENGEKALDMVGRQQGDTPDIILLDLKMPGMDGLDFLKHLRKKPESQNTPVVVLTASKDDDLMRRAYALGASTVIEKSKLFEAVPEVVQMMVDYWYKLARLPENMTEMDLIVERSLRKEVM